MRRLWLFALAFVLAFIVGCEKPGEEEREIPKDDTDWEIIHTSSDVMPNLATGDILSGGDFIAVGGGNGFVAISTDGGLSWESQNITAMDTMGFSVLAIDFADEQTGVLGGEASLFYTTDGGATWSRAQVSGVEIDSVDVKAVQYVGGGRFYALAGPYFLTSSDNGQSWTAHCIGLFEELGLGSNGFAFYDADHGVIVTTGSWVFYTSDGGATWSPETLATDKVFTAAAAKSAEEFLICGEEGKIFYRSAGDSVVWSGANNPRTNKQLSSIAVFGDYGIAVGIEGVAVISTDGGMNWDTTYALSTYGDQLWATFTPEGDAVLVVGVDPVRGGGSVRIGTGDLSSWVGANYGTNVILQDAAFTSPTEGVVVGKKATVLRTLDGGHTLLQRVLPYAFDITVSGVDFKNGSDGVAVGSDGAIFVTTDGGDHWNLVPQENIDVSGEIDHLNRVQFAGGDVVYAVGSDGIVLKSTDSGQSWFDVSPGVAAELMGLCFISETEGWVVGDAGVIVHTTDGGASWEEQSSGSNCALTGVSFVDASNGWACGNMALLRTTDGGQTWQATDVEPNLFTHFHDIGFVDAQRGWVVGNFGYILHTVDGGETWYRQAEGYTEANLYAIEVLDGAHVWAVGENGTVMRLLP